MSNLTRYFQRLKTMSPRCRKNHVQVCYCNGYWFPHRMYSKASEYFTQVYGTKGCIHDKANSNN